MISNSNLIIYACIAKGITILAEFSSSISIEPRIKAIAQQCIEKTPPNHSIFSHTIHKRTYTFLIETPFTYFAIFDLELQKSESLPFLNRVKSAFGEYCASNSINGFDDLSSLCFQDQFYYVFRKIVNFDVEMLNSETEELGVGDRNPKLDLTQGKVTVVRPLLSKPSKVFMKKKKRFVGGGCCGEVDGDHHHHHHHHHHVENHSNGGEDGNADVSKDFSVSMIQKSGGVFHLSDGRQKAKQTWRKHVWIVLILDLVVCAVLFGIWLWVCSGFDCIER